MLKRDFERYSSLRLQMSTFEEQLSLKELTESEAYLKLLKKRERIEKQMRRKRGFRKLFSRFPL